ncbi:MAG: cysteine hydrolase [Chloroflexi bacterium]|nr:cysteine hydrolase [Chloroflexota bacterium]
MKRFRSAEDLVRNSTPYLGYLVEWMDRLPSLSLQTEMRSRNVKADEVGIVVQDMVMAFCCMGGLASPRVKAVIDPIAALLKDAHSVGVRNFVRVEDHHRPDALEFAAYGPHSVQGTRESETVPEIMSLPFANLIELVPKNTIHPALGTDFEKWLHEHLNIKDFIVVGDCTDICVYQTAMYLKLRANAFAVDCRVIVPEDCVQTYDVPVEVASQKGAMPHNADLLHLVFLNHMALNGITVVRHVGK